MRSVEAGKTKQTKLRERGLFGAPLFLYPGGGRQHSGESTVRGLPVYFCGEIWYDTKMQKETQTQNYILRREYRKSLKLSITPQAEVLVQAPWNLSQAAISQFLEKHAAWIAAHLAEAEQNRASRQEWLESILFLGREYPVRRWAQREVCLSKANLYLPELDSPEKERRKVAAWYRAQAQVLLPRRTQFWAGKMQKNHRQVRISSARKRWGSCTGEGVISFSWRLLQAPPAAVDYVIIHELAHRYRMDHSREFWAYVEAYCPDYPARKRLLEQTAEAMRRTGWDV